jgi:organic radical activating enzyme
MPDEIKIIFEEGTDPESILLSINHHLTPSTHNLSSDTRHPTPILYLQPCDTGNVQKNARITEACIRYIEEHPQWRLSLQTHKLIGFK